MKELKIHLGILWEEILAGRMHYVVFDDWADSHDRNELPVNPQPRNGLNTPN